MGDPKDPERRYPEVEMPDRFVLEFQRPDGEWMDEAFCSPQNFVRNDDGSYLCWDGGSGLWIRAVQIDSDGVIDHVDDGGRDALSLVSPEQRSARGRSALLDRTRSTSLARRAQAASFGAGALSAPRGRLRRSVRRATVRGRPPALDGYGSETGPLAVIRL